MQRAANSVFLLLLLLLPLLLLAAAAAAVVVMMLPLLGQSAPVVRLWSLTVFLLLSTMSMFHN